MKKTIPFPVCLILFLSLFSCNKEQIELKSTRLDNNRIFVEMMNTAAMSGISKNSDGILCFNNAEHFKEVLSRLESYSERITEYDTTLCFDDVLLSFSAAMNFNSLHSHIENHVRFLEDKSQLFEDNDPDNHFIVNDFLRAILSPHGEIVVGDLLLVFREKFTLGIMNYNSEKVGMIREILSRNADESELYFLCNSHPDIFIVNPDAIVMNADFLAHRIPGQHNTFQFLNMTSCEDYNMVRYRWNFGDGTYSTDITPTHTYQTDGEYIVRMSAMYNGTITTTEKRINAGRLAAEVDFNYLHNNRGGYYFTIHSSTNGDTPSYYVVDFGDGNDTVIYTSSSRVNITHKYDEMFYNSEVTVQVTLHTVNNHYAFAQKFLTVRYKNCKKNCSAHSGTADVPHRPLNDTYFIKTAIQAVNVGIIHLHDINTKTVFLKKKNNGSFVREKADELKSGWGGLVYENHTIPDNSCGSPRATSRDKTRVKVKKVCCSYPPFESPLNSYSVDYQSLSSKLFAKKNTTVSSHLYGAKIYK